MALISPNKDYISYMNEYYVRNNGQEILIYKLDKKRTITDDLYMEEVGGRIYLPPFPLPAIYFDPKFQGVLGLNVFSQELTTGEGNQVFFMNFDNMVRKHFELKNGIVKTILTIIYSGKENIKLESSGEEILIYKMNELFVKFSYSDYRTVEKLIQVLNSVDGLTVNFEGENCPSKNIGVFSKIDITGRIANIELKEDLYKNITDVLQSGDIIVTEKNDVFEVVEGMPEGNFGWNFATYRITCKTANLRQASLPGFSSNSYSRNRSGLTSFVKMEK